MSDDLKIVVAAHKPYWMPTDSCYLPVWVGAALRDAAEPQGWARDDIGDSISEKNATFCELTALYWAWKNLGADYLGLAHYRRHFEQQLHYEKKRRVASGAFLMELLATHEAVLPSERNYFIETNYTQYVHAHHSEDLTALRSILVERYPSYLNAYDASMARTHGHRFNMFVMKRHLADEWCGWLFDVLFELENRLDISTYSINDQRVFGFVSERLFDPWLEKNRISSVNLPVVNLENQQWPKKIIAFLKRKWG